MSDLIDRQAAIDDFTKWKYQLADCFGEDYSGVSIVESAIKSLEGYPSAQPEDKCGECDAWNKYKNYQPPAQPEIIRCKDCKYVGTDATCCLVCNREGMGLKPYHVYHDDFCSYAERRTDDL